MYRTLIACALTLAASGAFADSLNPSLNPDLMTAGHGSGTSSTIIFTNPGPGFASNIVTTFVYASGTTAGGQRLFKEVDTCNGATVAAGGTCKVIISFMDACPAHNSALQYTLTTTTASGSVTRIPVWGTSTGGVCY